MKIRNPIRPVRTVPRHRLLYPYLGFALTVFSSLWTYDLYVQAEEARHWAEKHEKDFTACLKGEWRVTTEDGTEWGCLPVQANRKDKK